MRITRRPRVVELPTSSVRIGRDANGVATLWAADDRGLASALGLAHAHDRLVQMLLVRLIGQGRLCECLKGDDEMLEIDILMREMGFAAGAAAAVEQLTPAARALGEAYAEGVNHVLENERRPLELLLVGYRPEPWTLADTLLTVELMSYVGLAQSQQDMEHVLIEAVHQGVDVTRLKALCAPHLDGLDPETVELVRGLRIERPLVGGRVRFLRAAPAIRASNNWAVAPARSASGRALQCNDPHLECNRLPAVWYEAVMHTADDYRIGATMPGVPGLVMGRTGRLSFGFTYGFMDMVDYFIEDCRGTACRRGDGWAELELRTETVLRKGGEAVTLTIRESGLGVLECDSRDPGPLDGLYLCRAWSGHRAGAAASLDAIARVSEAGTVAEAQGVVREVAISCNWVLADRDGNIGYQQSGLLPDRRHSGLHPVPAWDSSRHWRGLVPADRLHSVLNPPEGFFATANDDLNPPDGPLVINLPMGSYRAERIRSQLEARASCTLDHMAELQNDLYSLQAERFMELFRPLLPTTFGGRMLANWDCRYDTDSRGATLFETVYEALLRKVFGEGLFGPEAWDQLVATTAIFADYYHLFDEAIFSGDRLWFGERGREAVISEVLAEQLSEVDPGAIQPWGRRRRVLMTNIFFSGALPAWLGFDRGPIELPGNRATVVQGGIFSSHGRQTTFAPSWRFLTDLGQDLARTVLAGGPSGRRCSRWYATDLERWRTGRYKTVRPEKSWEVET